MKIKIPKCSWVLSTQTLTQAISQRYSVRQFQEIPVPLEIAQELQERLQAIRIGPLGSLLRLELAAATSEVTAALRGLITYGAVKHPAAFILGAVKDGEHALEDYGSALEEAVLHATALGLGTCWLGGSFMQSGFARKIGKREDELIPAVAAAGYAFEDGRTRDPSRQRVGADQRLPWECLFFDGSFGIPLRRETAGYFQEALELLRLGPSAKNKQPWRVIRQGSGWHFYCQRTPGYGKGTLLFTLIRAADLQRVDIGIAMCHFSLALHAQGLSGSWTTQDPGLALPDSQIVYIATWVAV